MPTLHTLTERQAGDHAGRVALAMKQDGVWRERSYGDLHRSAQRLAASLVQRGLRRGDRAALLSEARPEWAAALLGAWRAGATVVPVDPRQTTAELAGILRDAQPAVLLASARTAPAAARLKGELGCLRDVLEIDRLFDGPGTAETSPAAAPAEIALLAYTSGTTGAPKGVEIRLASLDYQVDTLADVVGIGRDDAFLSLLPPHHLLELTGGLLAPLAAGASVGYPGSLLPQDVLAALGERGVTHVLTVPLLLKLLRAEIENAVARAGLPLFGALHRVLGARFRCFVAGGAPLDGDIEDFFSRVGITVLQGYGLTETSPVVSVQTTGARRRGSVGRPLPGLEVRVGPDGEILTRGPQVMAGYRGQPEKTREVIDGDGWLHTGDLGRLDADGFLYVTGRIKDLIVLGSGRKVQPEEVEEALSRGRAFAEVCVVGGRARGGLLEGTEQVCAVVVPAEPPARRGSDPGPGVEEAARRGVAELVKDLSPYKHPVRVVVRREPLPRSATLKVQRHLVREWLQALDGGRS